MTAVEHPAPVPQPGAVPARREVLAPQSLALESGYDIRTIQELLGHKDVNTTMIYTHVLSKGDQGVRSPVDAL